MATPWTPFDVTAADMLNVYCRGVTQPTTFNLILTNGSWDSSAIYATVVGTEIVASNGYSTGGYVITPSINATDSPLLNLAFIDFLAADVVATGGNITFTRAVIVVDSSKLFFYRDYGSVQTVVPGTPRTIETILNLGEGNVDVNVDPS